MDSEAYWQKRAEEREAEWHKKCQKAIDKELAAYYQQALAHIRDDVAVLYARFGAQNGMTNQEARAWLQSDEYRVWRMDIEEYVRRVEASGDEKLLRELNTLAMRSRITRLDKLYGDTLKELIKLGGEVEKWMTDFLVDAYEDGYYQTLYEIGKEAGMRLPVNILDRKGVENVVRTPWSGKNYSKRLWKNTDLLNTELQRTMQAAVHRGLSLDKLSNQLAERMTVGKNVAARLVQTELNFTQNQSALDSMHDAGMKYYRFIATLDSRTTQQCRSHDGRVFKVEDASPGSNMPPLHPRCRSTISGCLRGLKDKPKGTRIARDPDTNKTTMYVPAGMRYNDWKTVFVEKKYSVNEWKMRMNLIPPTESFISQIAKQYGIEYTVGKKGDDIFYSDDGKPIYPMNDGAIGYQENATLKKGSIILDRYGVSTGRFVSPEGTPMDDRALPRNTNFSNYHKYRVIKDLPNCMKSIIAAWFGKKGGGIQYKLPERIADLKDYLEEVL